MACVNIWLLRFVDWANFLLHPSNGHTYGRSPVCILTCVLKMQSFNYFYRVNGIKTYLKLKSRLKRLPQPSKVHWNGFSPVWTSWCRFNLLDSTKALPHSAQTCTLGPCVCKCFLIAELSRNILLQPLCGQPTRISFKTFSLIFSKFFTYCSVRGVVVWWSSHTRTF